MESTKWLEERNAENWIMAHLNWCKVLADSHLPAECADIAGKKGVTSGTSKMIHKGVQYGILHPHGMRGPYSLTKKGKEMYERLLEEK